MTTWFLLLFITLPNGQYVDKIAVPMTGTIEQQCERDSTGIYRYKGKLEGTDRHSVLTVCQTVKAWRGQ